jgi:hypothetical protein
VPLGRRPFPSPLLLPALLFLALLPLGCATTGPADRDPQEPPDPLVVPTVPPRPTGPGVDPAPEVRAGERVTGIRLARDPIRLQVGESVAFDALEAVAVDADGAPVPEARVLVAPLQGRVAVFQDGVITALEEGEVQLTLAVLVLGPGGQPEPRLFPRRIVVTGPPVVSLEVVPPPLTLYAGTTLPFEVRARTAAGDLRSSVELDWSSRNPEIASVGRSGLVRGHRPGRAALVVSGEGVEVTHLVEVRENPVRSVVVEPSGASVRTGDVLSLRARALDGGGREVGDVALAWGVGIPGQGGARVAEEGPGAASFVAEGPGSHRLLVSAGGVATEAVVDVRPRGVEVQAHVVGMGLRGGQPSSELEVFRGRDGRDYAYMGTHAGGARLLVWDVTEPTGPALVDSLRLEGRGVTDVRVAADGGLAVVAEGGNGSGAIVVLDVTQPARPRVVGRHTAGFQGEVTRLFLDGTLLYAVDGGAGDLRVLDLSDPGAPAEVGRWGMEAPGREVRDVRVAGGVVVVAHGDHGVWLLDVGGGEVGGTPEAPRVMAHWWEPGVHAQVAALHRAPEGRSWLLVGEEVFGCPTCLARTGPHDEGFRGGIRILSMEDPTAPVEVARYEVPEAGVRNLAVEGERLLAAYGQGGLRVVDLSGELRGDLYRQGRESAWLPTGHPAGWAANTPMARGVRVHRGHVFVSDLNSGLWIVRLGASPPAP